MYLCAFVCVCVCVCVHACVCIHVHAFLCHVYKHLCMPVWVPPCLCVSMCVCVCMPVREHLCTRVSLCVCLYCTTVSTINYHLMFTRLLKKARPVGWIMHWLQSTANQSKIFISSFLHHAHVTSFTAFLHHASYFIHLISSPCPRYFIPQESAV